MEEFPILNIIGGVLLFIAKTLLVIASSMVYYRKRSTASTLMLIGSISIILGDALAIFLITKAGNLGAEEVLKYTGINSILKAMTYIIFALGVLFYVVSNRNQQSSGNAQLTSRN